MLPDFLKVCRETWDEIAALANHQRVKEGLMACLTSVGEINETGYHDPDVRLYHTPLSMNSTNAAQWKDTQTAIDRILTIDAIAIDALLLEVLRDTARYRRLLKQRDREAQSLLDLIQAVSRLLLTFNHPMPIPNSVWIFPSISPSKVIMSERL
jgi:hypothetical protein